MAQTYTTRFNIKNQRPQALEDLRAIFEHIDPLNATLTAISIGAGGAVTLTFQAALPADQATHLGLT